VIVFVSKSEADCRTLREVAGLVSQSVVCCADGQEARMAIRRHEPTIVVCEAQGRESGNWQEFLSLPFDRDELRLVLSSALRHSPRASFAAAAGGGLGARQE
jgi:hypothetical protein